MLVQKKFRMIWLEVLACKFESEDFRKASFDMLKKVEAEVYKNGYWW